MIDALHVPGRSWLHRLPAWLKLAGLAALSTGLVLVDDLWLLLGGLATVTLAYPLAGVGRRLGRLLWSLVPLVGLIGLSQAWVMGPEAGAVVCARLTPLILAATLVTYTTSLSAMMAVLEGLLRPLRVVGLEPRAVAFALSLTLRFVPVLAGLARESREALAARGRDRALTALVQTLLLRALRLADQVSEAVEARGLEATRPKK
ncbi:energy-coupling factor transporter transmembrane component T family protein [Pararhodospirillum photometricum]|uniref:Cobalt transport protein n=1 Tax=Pararhodospirillum photometricum DSM 122 TaxID=1150469 RepID=H6SJ70_PARPM|nr:energy-coupling factor transporter transmembrane protein EcfT [Pararhodospirillum photometricum]CCG08035.1 Cobalt transport protein [Pararhodospirillum photometricum DSM 122]